jgi:hypothetical protein
VPIGEHLGPGVGDLTITVTPTDPNPCISMCTVNGTT